MTTTLSRRDWLKAAGLFSAGSIMSSSALSEILHRPSSAESAGPRFLPPSPLTAIVAGAGNRGNTYASFALKYPDQLKIRGFAEPIPFRNDRFARKHAIEDRYRFTTWEEIFRIPKFADAVIITTPDHLHYGPAMAALEMGYDLILEKPIAQSWKECGEIMRLAEGRDRVVAICHVLRYAPFFVKIKDVIDSGAIGKVVSIQLMEPVQNIHMSHSFVRGNWRNTKESNPMLLSKSCHDLDLLTWYLGKPCVKVGSFGSLTWFRKENAPPGSPARCTDGCPVEADCPYSAHRIYYRNRLYLQHFDLPEEGDKGPAILEHIKAGPYGRCVYRCDNDVVDHQVVMMEFEGSVTANFNMEALTNYGGRRIRVMGTEGDLVGDEEDLIVSNFRSGASAKWNVKEHVAIDSGHGGGDYGLVNDFIRASSQANPGLLKSSIAEAMQSHLIAFRAEVARERGSIIAVGPVK